MRYFLICLVFACSLQSPAWAQGNAPASWKKAPSTLMTRWGESLTPADTWTEYPRPGLTREQWTNLNGLWDYAVTDKGAGQPEQWDGQILVPFAVESALSGVGKTVGADNCLWYRTRFSLSHPNAGKRVLLHFGAVDWQCTVWINGHLVGSHLGGYDPFSFDITATPLA